MDQRRGGVTLVGDSTQYGLKHMLPECFVSVKLETYEEGSGVEIQDNSVTQSTSTQDRPSESNFVPSQPPINQDTGGSQSSSTCNNSPSKQLCTVPCSAPSASTHIVYQVQMATPMMQQTQATNQSQSSQQQPTPSQGPQVAHANELPHVSQAEGEVSRPPAQATAPPTLPPSHSFSHAHTRPSEIAWLSHTYVDQGTQHFHGHQMPYLPNDAAMLTSMPLPQIQAHEGARVVKQISGSRTCPSTGACGSGNNQPSITSVSAGDTGDSNTFISYVLNPQRGASGSGIFLLDASRGLTTQTPHQVQERNTIHEAQAQSVSTRSSSVPLSDSGSILGSPKPGESHLISRSCQTIVTMSQIQDAPLMPDGKIIITGAQASDLDAEPIDSKERVFAEADCEDSQEVSSMVSECDSENRKPGIGSHCPNFQREEDFRHQQAIQNCQGQVHCVTAAVNIKCVVEQNNGITKTRDTRSETIQHETEASSKDNICESGGSPDFQYLENYKPFRCDICGKTYPSQQALINHDRYHRGERPYECETCHKAFATNSHLVTHRRTHTGERPFQCQLCQRRFADRSAFVKHERTHGPNGSVIKRYKCEECGSGFVDSCGLKKHIRIHTGERPYVCNVCAKTFSTSSTFVAHKRIHTGERPYKCESCDKMFITKSHLLTHRRTHTGEKPFTCSVCNRCFADGSSFRRHERLHTGENRHICMQCGRGFPLESSLEKHKQTHVQTSAYSYVPVMT